MCLSIVRLLAVSEENLEIGSISWSPGVTGELICALLGLPVVLLGLGLLVRSHFRDTQLPYQTIQPPDIQPHEPCHRWICLYHLVWPCHQVHTNGDPYKWILINLTERWNKSFLSSRIDRNEWLKRDEVHRVGIIMLLLYTWQIYFVDCFQNTPIFFLRSRDHEGKISHLHFANLHTRLQISPMSVTFNRY